jgi:hypothetical protein
MEPTATKPSSAPISPHDAHQRACWQALWRRLLQPTSPPTESPAEPDAAAAESN